MEPLIAQKIADIAAILMKGRQGGKLDLDLYVLSADGYDDIEIALPTEPSRRDFTNRIGDAIETLAAVEQRPPEVVAEDPLHRL
jgi:hypothetical protein